MTVKISKPALNLREELASLRNQGGFPKEDKLYLDDLVTNGDFSNGTTGWTNSPATASLAVSNGSLTLTRNGASGEAQQLLETETGKSYMITFTLSAVSHGAAVNYQGYSSGVKSTAGTYSFIAVGNENFTKNLKLQIFNSNTGTATFDNVSVQEVGENLVTNGTFDSDSQWGKGVGWTISGGTASSDGSQTSGSSLTLNNASKYETGKTYTVTFTISNYSAGGVNPHIRGDAFGEVSGNGTHTVTGVAGSSSPTGINMYASSTFVGSIDNVIVTEGSHHVIQIIPNGYDVKDVYINGELAREGEAYDYQVQTDGINQWLKPTVEPTATTETVVIGVRK
jgi:hypothetical protein